MKHIYYVALLITMLFDAAIALDMALERVVPTITRLARCNAMRIIQNRGQDEIYVPKYFWDGPVIAPLTQFSAFVQNNISFTKSAVESTKIKYPAFQDPRTPYEKTFSSLKDEQLEFEMSLRPTQIPAPIFSNLEIKTPEGRSIRYVTANEIDLTRADPEQPIICAWDVSNVAVIFSNTKKKTALMAHVMETAILDGAFKKCVKEICNDSDVNDLQLSMLTTDIPYDSRVIAGVQNKISKFFESHLGSTLKQKRHFLAYGPKSIAVGYGPKRNCLVSAPKMINVAYDPRDNSTYVLHQDTNLCFTNQEEIEFSLRYAAAISTPFLKVDFNNRSTLTKLDDQARLNHYYNLLSLPFTLFEQMVPLGVQVRHPDFHFPPTTKEKVLRHFFKEFL